MYKSEIKGVEIHVELGSNGFKIVITRHLTTFLTKTVTNGIYRVFTVKIHHIYIDLRLNQNCLCPKALSKMGFEWKGAILKFKVYDHCAESKRSWLQKFKAGIWVKFFKSGYFLIKDRICSVNDQLLFVHDRLLSLRIVYITIQPENTVLLKNPCFSRNF